MLDGCLDSRGKERFNVIVVLASTTHRDRTANYPNQQRLSLCPSKPLQLKSTASMGRVRTKVCPESSELPQES
jgi:hypothetical protein